MKSVLSLVVALVALYVLVFQPSEIATHEWAVGVLGFILGYWLKDSPLGGKLP